MTKIKIRPKSVDIPEPKRSTEQAPGVQPELKKKKEKGILGKMLLLIRSDIHKKISGNGKVKMPESTESWEDWKDQL